MVSGIMRLPGDALVVTGFVIVGYAIAAPGPGFWRSRRKERDEAPRAVPSHRFKDTFPSSGPVRRSAASVAVGITLALVTSWPTMLLIGAAGAWFLPRLLAFDGGAAAQIAKIEAIATFAELLRDTLSAAAGLGQAIAAAAACAAAPIDTEAKRLAVTVQDRTVPIERALRTFADQLADPAADEIVMALMFAVRHSASDLASLLSSLAGHVRAEAAMHRRILVAGSRKQTAVRLITAITLGMGVVLFTFGGRLMAPYGTPLGQCVLLLVAGLFAVGYRWLMRLSRPTVPPRLLRGADASTRLDPRIPTQSRGTARRAASASVTAEGGR